MPRRKGNKFQYADPPVFKYQTFERDTRESLTYSQNPLFPSQRILFSDRFTNSSPQPEGIPESELEKSTTDEGRMSRETFQRRRLMFESGYVSNEPQSLSTSKAALSPSMAPVEEEVQDDDAQPESEGMLQSPKPLERRLRGSLDVKSALDLSELGETDLNEEALGQETAEATPKEINSVEATVEDEGTVEVHDDAPLLETSPIPSRSPTPAPSEPSLDGNPDDVENVQSDGVDTPVPAVIDDQENKLEADQAIELSGDLTIEDIETLVTKEIEDDALPSETVPDQIVEPIHESYVDSDFTAPVETEDTAVNNGTTDVQDETEEIVLPPEDVAVKTEEVVVESGPDNTVKPEEDNPRSGSAEGDNYTEAVDHDKAAGDELDADKQAETEVAASDPAAAVSAEPDDDLTLENDIKDEPQASVDGKDAGESTISDEPATEATVEKAVPSETNDDLAEDASPEPNDSDAKQGEQSEPPEEGDASSTLPAEFDPGDETQQDASPEGDDSSPVAEVSPEEAEKQDLPPQTDDDNSAAIEAELEADRAESSEHTGSQTAEGEQKAENDAQDDEITAAETIPGEFPADDVDVEGTPDNENADTSTANAPEDDKVKEDSTMEPLTEEPGAVTDEVQVESAGAENVVDADAHSGDPITVVAKEAPTEEAPTEDAIPEEGFVDGECLAGHVANEEVIVTDEGTAEETTKEISEEPVPPEEHQPDPKKSHRENLVLAASAGAAAAVAAHELRRSRRKKERGHWEREPQSPSTSTFKDEKHLLERDRDKNKPFSSALARQIEKAKEDRDRYHDSEEYKEKQRRRRERREAREREEAEERRKEREIVRKREEIQLAYDRAMSKKTEELKAKDADKQRQGESENRQKETEEQRVRGMKTSSRHHRTSSMRSSNGSGSERPALLKRMTTGESDIGGRLLMLNMAKAGGYGPQDMSRSAPLSPPRSTKSPVLARTGTDHGSESGTDADGRRRHRHAKRHHSRRGTREESIETTTRKDPDGSVVMREKLIRRVTSNGKDYDDGPPGLKLWRRMTDAIKK